MIGLNANQRRELRAKRTAVTWDLLKTFVFGCLGASVITPYFKTGTLLAEGSSVVVFVATSGFCFTIWLNANKAR